MYIDLWQSLIVLPWENQIQQPTENLLFQIRGLTIYCPWPRLNSHPNAPVLTSCLGDYFITNG